MSPTKQHLCRRLKVQLLLLGSKRSRRYWVRPINTSRRIESEFFRLVLEMKGSDPEAFFRYMRMDAASFDELVEILRPRIQRQRTRLREPISPEERLAVTLR